MWYVDHFALIVWPESDALTCRKSGMRVDFMYLGEERIKANKAEGKTG